MKRKIMIVDDIESNRAMLCAMLGGEYDIIEADDGQKALDTMKREYLDISAVLLDLFMPVMDGFEVLRRMMEDEMLMQIPVIVGTASTDAFSEEKALALGANDYIAKPYNPPIVRQRVRNTIKLRETAATANAMKYDKLTGLYSREAFFEIVEKMVSEKESGYYILACFDIDKFKVVNDQYGTKKGDEILKHIATTFRKGFEEHGGVCCRIASDDFAVLYPTEFSRSEEIKEIRRSASRVDGIVAQISFCIGRYLVNDLNLTTSAMYDRAILAAESVKNQFDIKIGTYDESMRDKLILEQRLVNDMQSALENHEFEAWYQPQYNHSTGAIIGAEALVRWRHRERGLIPPSIFIPVFEQNGFIYSLDKYVWEEVCIYLHDEIEKGLNPLPISVNISRHDVFHQDMVDIIIGLVEKYSIPVELLRLEITESAFTESTTQIIEVAKKLIAKGFTLEIDDFGSGYSSLNTLKDVPAQVVKLDMRFLEDGNDSQRGGNIVQSVVRMAKWLGMSVIAEGVETKEQADFLLSVGCNYIQGYYYAKPMMEHEYRNQCNAVHKEEKLLTMETVENLDNNAFWNPKSMDSIIFNSYVGAASIFEYYRDKIDLLRTTKKYVQMIGGAGMTIEDAVRINWSDHLDEASRERLKANLKKSIETRSEVVGEYTFVNLPGCTQDVYLRTTMRVIASAGERHLVYCINEDMTAQLEAEKKGEKLSEQMRAILENVDVGIVACIIKPESVKFVLANNQYYQMLGYTEEQFKAEIEDPFSPILDEDRTHIIEECIKIPQYNSHKVFEYRVTCRDGKIKWLRTMISIGTFTGVDDKIHISIFRDITSEKLAEQEKAETARQLQNIMNDMPGGFCRMQVFSDGAIKPVYVNKGFCNLIGMSTKEIMELYKNDARAGVHPDDVCIVNDAVDRMLANGQANSSRYRLMHGNGDYVWLSIFGRVSKYATGETFLNIYYIDASEQMRAEEQQKELLDNLPHGAALYLYKGNDIEALHLNKRYWELVNRKTTDVSAKGAVMEAIYPDDREMVIQEIKAAIKQKRLVVCDVRLKYGKTGYKPFHITGRVLPRDDGQCAIYASYSPISDGVMTVQELLPTVMDAVMGK